MIDSKELLNFIALAHKNTYAAPDHIRSTYRVQTPILTGHNEYEFSKGSWRYYDSYAGVYRAPGREVVFFDNEPIWSMSYAGAMKPEFRKTAAEIYAFLKHSLMQIDDKQPFRGPSHWTDGKFTYRFAYQGNIEFLVGRESIFRDDDEIFFQQIIASTIE